MAGWRSMRKREGRTNKMARSWLIDIRRERGYSQKAVAELIGVKQPSYCNIENGMRNPTVETAKKIAEVLRIEWTRFYE